MSSKNSSSSPRQLISILCLQTDVGLGKGKPYTVSSKVAKKKMSGYKLKGGFPPAGKMGFQKRQRSALEFGRKRGTKPKMRGVFGVPGLGLQRPQAPDTKTPEDEPSKWRFLMCDCPFMFQIHKKSRQKTHLLKI